MICPLRKSKNIIKAYEGEVKLLEKRIMECENKAELEDLENKLNLSRRILETLNNIY